MHIRFLPRRLHSKSSAALAQNQSGAVAIEFAIVIPIFFLLLLSAIELGAIHYTSSTVDVLSNQAARSAKTGNNYGHAATNIAAGQDGAFDGAATGDHGHFSVDGDGNITLRGRESYIRELLRDSGVGLDPERISLETRISSGFSSASFTSTKASAYNVGNDGQVVTYVVTYEWNVLTPLLMPFLGTKHYIKSAAITKNEFF